MRKVVRLFVTLFLGVGMTIGIVGCNKEPSYVEMPSEALYSLQEAYDYGWLTREDLQSIADYRRNSTPYPESLSEETAQSIKSAWLEREIERDSKWADGKTEADVSINHYYGTYHDCVAVIVDFLGTHYPDVYGPYIITIGKVEFHYSNHYMPTIIVWKI